MTACDELLRRAGSRTSQTNGQTVAAGGPDGRGGVLEQLAPASGHRARAPSPASSSAVARPMPVPPPVTSAERPLRLPSRRTLSTRRILRARHSLTSCAEAPAARASSASSAASA